MCREPQLLMWHHPTPHANLHILLLQYKAEPGIALRHFSICTFYCRSTRLDLALHYPPIRLQITLTLATHQNSCFSLPPHTTGTVIDFFYTTRGTKPLLVLFKLQSSARKFSVVQTRPFSLVETVIMLTYAQYITAISVCSSLQCQMHEMK